MNEVLRRILFLPPQASTEASKIDYLHYFVILITMAGAGFVFLLGLLFLVRYRVRSKAQPEGATTRPQHWPVWLEYLIAGGLLGLFVLWWFIGFMQYVTIRTPPPNALDVYVTAKQWMWKFAYPDGNHTLSTLYVPAARPIKLVMTSRDVIHSFFVPDFRLKQDVLPGRYTTLWFEAKEPGRHEVLCAEFCGTGHSVMRAQIVVLAPADYARWLAGAQSESQTPGPPRQEPAVVEQFAPKSPLSLVKEGERAAAQHGCLRCHTLDGSAYIGPSFAGLYMSSVPLQGGGTVTADEAYITESMMDPRVRLHSGYSAIMPSYIGLITPAETAAIVELIKSLRGVSRQDRPSPTTPVPPPTNGQPASSGQNRPGNDAAPPSTSPSQGNTR